jgi:hypothetical protein
MKMESYKTKLHGSTPMQGHNYNIQTIESTTDAQKEKEMQDIN